jgi:hypothetical protein
MTNTVAPQMNAESKVYVATEVDAQAAPRQLHKPPPIGVLKTRIKRVDNKPNQADNFDRHVIQYNSCGLDGSQRVFEVCTLKAAAGKRAKKQMA